MLEIGERVICTKGENWNTLVLGKTYEIADRALDGWHYGQAIQRRQRWLGGDHNRQGP